jgi:hypothetical protein
MAFRLSDGLRTALVGTNGQGFGEVMDNGVMAIYTGAQPANANAVETPGCTLLATITSTSGTTPADGLKFGTAGNGVLPIGTPAWSGRVVATGVAGWFRFYGSDGTGGIRGTSGTAVRFDGAIGVSGADLNLSHTSLTQDSTLTITTFNVTQPAE